MKPIEPLFERDGLPRFGLPAALATSYGGDFGLARPTLYANFVCAVDGVVALPGPARKSLMQYMADGGSCLRRLAATKTEIVVHEGAVLRSSSKRGA